MKTPSLILALVPALFLTSCYVTPDGGPYRPPGPRPGAGYRGDHRPGYGYGRDHDRHDHRDDHRGHGHDRDRDGRYDRDDDRDGGRDRYGRDPRTGYRDPRGPGGVGSRLPSGARPVVHGGATYYTTGRSWYRASGSGYIEVQRPY